MKRDLDLIRRILIEVEKHPGGGSVRLQIPEYHRSVVSYHVGLLAEAGFVKALMVGGTTREDWVPLRLTWQGHEFLAAAQNEGIWKQVTEFIRSRLGDVPISVLQAVLTYYVKKRLESRAPAQAEGQGRTTARAPEQA